MSKTGFGVTVGFALGLALMLAASPASGIFCWNCSCSSSCNQVCINGPEIPDCPGCNESTCELSGPACIDFCGGGCTTCTSTINGTSAGNTLNGTSANECINGFGGNDTIDGNAGDDTIYCGAGTDTAYGDSGNDCLYGEGDNDNLNGETGSSDFADGGSGTDTCTAESEVSCEI